MDISFDIHNGKSDLVRVALSYYDTDSLQTFTDDPSILTLVFYDVTLVRISGDGIVDLRTLKAICDVLYKFMADNDASVLCFYCDDLTDVTRRHKEITPQEYRSRLFSRMFEMYVLENGITNIQNYGIKIEDNGTPRFAHFITPEKYLSSIKLLEGIIRMK